VFAFFVQLNQNEQKEYVMTKTTNILLTAVLILALMLNFVPSVPAFAASTPVFINEIHYDNDGTDAGEAIEIAGQAGTNLAGWSIVLYNGSGGAVYDTDVISGSISNQQDGYGTVVLTYPSNGIQNGSPDGIALVDASNTVVQFLSYEGSFIAVGGPADGMLSTDIGVSEPSNNPLGFSLQLTGSGSFYEDFTWAAAGANTFGNVNSGQTFVGLAANPLLNEFVFNHVGTDTNEFVEIKGDANTDYSAFAILQIEGDTTSAGIIDSVHTLGTTDANGYWITGFLSNLFENGTVTLILVKDFSGSTGNDLDTNNDGVLDSAPWTSIADDVAVFDGGASDFTYSGTVLAPGFSGNPFTPGGASRIPDGTDTDTSGDWMVNDFDGAGIPGFGGTPIVGEAYNTPGAMNAVVLPPTPQLVINEIDYDQPSTDTSEFVEIRNNGDTPVDLTGWTLELVNGNAGGAIVYQTIALPAVTLAGGDYFVVCANAATVADCDLDASPDTNLIQNGAPDAVGLLFNGTLIDTVSYEGDTGAPFTEGSGAGIEDTSNGSISRFPDGIDTDQNNIDFVFTVTGTPGSANVCVDDAPAVTNTYPIDGENDFPIGANLSVTFSEPVNVSGVWYQLSCSVSGIVNATVSGDLTSFTLDPQGDLVGRETGTLTVYAANVTDQDVDDPPDNVIDLQLVYAI
jgi:hypothetical protein